MNDRSTLHVIGAGLAGSEAAWQLAERGWSVRLFEMRPATPTPAHASGSAAEMVCSNSFKSEDPDSATGILKAEMTRMGSLILRCAHATRVPAGNSLAVDREAFSEMVTQALRSHPRITWVEEMVAAPDPSVPTLIATGPLTADPLAEWIAGATHREGLHFYDAIAPIVVRDSIDMEKAWMGARYQKGDPDFINCCLNRDQYEAFVDAVLAAEKAALHDFDTPFFEACLPIEVMAERGRETLRFGPMKPKGLPDPRTGREPYAAVQLRQDSLAGDHFNLVGFQTRMKWGAQREVFRLIPGLDSAEFVRFGSIHRNTYVQAPKVLDPTLAVRDRANLWIAGQVSGVEGYLESAAGGLAAAHGMDRALRSLPPLPFPRTTMLGSLLHYITHANPKDFGPTNAMLGLLPELPEQSFDARAAKRASGRAGVRKAKGAVHRARSLADLEAYLTR